MKKKTKILLYALFILLLGGIVIGTNVSRKRALVRGVQVQIDYGQSDTLVSQSTIQTMIEVGFPTLTSQHIQDVDLNKIRQEVLTNPYVEKCEISASVNRHIMLKITQRTPLLHLYLGKKECYLDHEGHTMPMSTEGEANVMVGTGDPLVQYSRFLDSTGINVEALAADTTKHHYALVQMWEVARIIHDDEEFSALFDQIHILPNRDMVLVPKVGNHTVLLGDLTDLGDNWEAELVKKLNDLLVFYRKGMREVGWDTYKQINLKYKGQVICTEK